MGEIITKVCSKCKEEKPVDNFGIDRGRVKAECKKCATAYSLKWAVDNKDKKNENNAKWRENNADKMRGMRKAWRVANLEKLVEYQNIRKARKSELEHTFTNKEWKSTLSHFDNKCAYCGCSGKMTQDHFVPLLSGGCYTANNIVPACGKCNSSKGFKNVRDWLCTKENGIEIYNKISEYLHDK